MKALALVFLVACSVAQTVDDGDGENDSFINDAGKADAFGVAEGSPQAIGVLRVANELSFADLKSKVKLVSTAATHIDAYKMGGTITIKTLHELDAIPYVGPAAFGHLLTYAEANGFVPMTTGCAGWTDTKLQLDFASLVDLKIDANGGTHLLLADTSGYTPPNDPTSTGLAPGIRYQVKPKGGAWQEPEPIEANNNLDYTGGHLSLALDSNGVPHAVWEWIPPTSQINPPYALVHYSHRNANGTWTTPVTAGTGTQLDDLPALAIDSANTLHLVRKTTNGVVYATKAANATTWSETNVSSETPSWISFVIGSDGSDHIVYTQGGNVRYAYRAANTSGFTIETVFAQSVNYTDDQLGLVVDHAGAVHVTFKGDTTLREAVKPKNGTWTVAPVLGAIGGNYSDLKIDASGTIHASYDRSASFLGATWLEHATWSGGAWQTPEIVEPRGFDNVGLRSKLALDSDGHPTIATVGAVNSTIGLGEVFAYCP